MEGCQTNLLSADVVRMPHMRRQKPHRNVLSGTQQFHDTTPLIRLFCSSDALRLLHGTNFANSKGVQNFEVQLGVSLWRSNRPSTWSGDAMYGVTADQDSRNTRRLP